MDELQPRILLTANTAWYLYNFRANLIRALIGGGNSVVVLAPEDRFSRKLQDIGAQVFNIEIDQRGASPFADFSTLIKYLRLLRGLSPDVVVSFTVKPVIYGSVAARVLGFPHINTITGLGSAFIFQAGMRHLVSVMYRYSLKKSRVVFFQNKTDMMHFVKAKLVREGQCKLVAGSGVDLEKFSPLPMPTRPETVFLMVARLFKDKGIYEFVEAADGLNQEKRNVVFRLVGPLDCSGNQFAVREEELALWVREGVIDYRGEVDDVREEMRSADCVVLPSYREGMSKVLMEAAAVARPIIAADVPGCRDIVTEGENGYLCTPRNGDELRKAMCRFLGLSPDARQNMADASRLLAVSRFGEKAVVDAYLNAISDTDEVS